MREHCGRCNKSPLDYQVGGGHYKKFRIQPVEFIQKNKLGFIEGNIIKYICRYSIKKQKEDLLKAKHYIDILLELEKDEYPEEGNNYDY